MTLKPVNTDRITIITIPTTAPKVKASIRYSTTAVTPKPFSKNLKVQIRDFPFRCLPKVSNVSKSNKKDLLVRSTYWYNRTVFFLLGTSEVLLNQTREFTSKAMQWWKWTAWLPCQLINEKYTSLGNWMKLLFGQKLIVVSQSERKNAFSTELWGVLSICQPLLFHRN